MIMVAPGDEARPPALEDILALPADQAHNAYHHLTHWLPDGGADPTDAELDAVPYDLQDIYAPSLFGKMLDLAAPVIETVPPVKNRLSTDSNLFLLRQTGPRDPPSALPLVLPTHAQKALAQTQAARGPLGQLRDLFADEEAPPGVPSGASEGTFVPETSAMLRTLYASGKLSPVDVAKSFLARAQGSAGENLRAFVAINEADLLAQAEASASRWRAGSPLSPLDGVPVCVKDEFRQSAYPLTTGGSCVLTGAPGEFGLQGDTPGSEEAACVALLRRAGALLVGKTNMHELGLGVTGTNIHHGTPVNPRALGFATGGSSSGTASAVAAGLCPLGVGADGGGSVRIPASFCGIWGLKPTFGRVSEAGAVPLVCSVGHAGPLATNVADLAAGYLAMAGPDPAGVDPVVSLQPTPHLAGVRAALRLKSDTLAGSLAGVRIGIPRHYFRHVFESACVEGPRAFLRILRDRTGVELVPCALPELEESRVAHLISITSEMQSFSDAYGGGAAAAGMAPSTRICLSMMDTLTPTDLVRAQRQRTRAIEYLRRMFDGDPTGALGSNRYSSSEDSSMPARHRPLSLIASPATGIAAPDVPYSMVPGRGDALEATPLSRIMRFSSLANLTGVPSIVVPVGVDRQGRPLGLQLAGRWWDEHLLLRVAAVCEALLRDIGPARDLLPGEADPLPEEGPQVPLKNGAPLPEGGSGCRVGMQATPEVYLPHFSRA
ncbi:hypothetical protein H696_03155 [Fonticula alba]|uniref:Amidase domain-containing protein n=1 Tax=Fonticula alba TaxID=691883 RepID=A0A058Z911_FONAL|nr:hypothetical protein H696_03155 [Fonticula alba]KCV70804.1 hypothetical protein H696_03155 [Fonticula alba]|eukprot:XP_009495320.1 hypothetical protein H696_03155 [Fonticula alba]